MAAAAFAHPRPRGNSPTPRGVARELEHYVGTGGGIFAIILLNASIIGAAAVTLSTSYAFGDVFGCPHSLHRCGERPSASTACSPPWWRWPPGIAHPGRAAGGDHHQRPGACRLLLPRATVFLLLLCNDKDVLGPWVNRRG